MLGWQLQVPRALGMCQQAHEPQVCMNPRAVRFCMHMPCATPGTIMHSPHIHEQPAVSSAAAPCPCIWHPYSGVAKGTVACNRAGVTLTRVRCAAPIRQHACMRSTAAGWHTAATSTLQDFARGRRRGQARSNAGVCLWHIRSLVMLYIQRANCNPALHNGTFRQNQLLPLLHSITPPTGAPDALRSRLNGVHPRHNLR